MDTIFKEAAIEIMTGKDGLCAWASSKLGWLALRKAKQDLVSRDDPDYDRWVRSTGFAPLTESDEFEKWVWFFSSLIDGQSKMIYDAEVNFSLEDAIKYKADQELAKKGTKSFSPGLYAELREEAEMKWSEIQSVEPIAQFPAGSYDELKARLQERRSTVYLKHKESEHKTRRLDTLDLAILNC